MNTITFSQEGGPGNELNPDTPIMEFIYPYEYERNITDGGEFLDDALRMNDQPFGKTPAAQYERSSADDQANNNL